MQRIEAFLKENEVPIWACSLGREVPAPSTSTTSSSASSTREECPVGFENATFEWQSSKSKEEGTSRFQLGPLDLTLPQGKLTIISGATGSGKSALLHALLGGASCLVNFQSRSRFTRCFQKCIVFPETSSWTSQITVSPTALKPLV